ALKVRLRVARTAGLQEQVDSEEHQPPLRPTILKNPEALFDILQGLRFAALTEAEFGKPQITPWRGQILGSESYARVHIAVTLREKVEDALKPIVAAGEMVVRTPLAYTRRQHLPGAFQQRAAMPVGIVDLIDPTLDPVDRAFHKLERKPGARARREIGNGVENRV